MFSSALKSFSSNITSNYTISATPSSYSGPWKIFDAKKKSTSKAVSVFVFDKKSLEPQAGLGLGRSGGSLKRIHEEVIERLKKEATSLARLRHPSILELVEPVEETRNGGLMFATEPVTASLAGLLTDKDAQEKASGVGGRSSRFVVEDADGRGRRRREVEIDDLEIQKGLLQVAKGLEFLHESAGLVHGNLTPESIYINAKSDWKISGLGFSSPPDNSTTSTSVVPVALSEVLNHDTRLPRFVQLNLDYTSPDFVIDSNLNTSADLFSLGLLIVALFNSPHSSPLQTNSSPSTYKRLFSSSATTPSASNQFLSSRPLPKELSSSVLPKLVTRRPAQRLTAREFQQSQYFDNILVSTIRFLDSLPAKTPNEKAQFMRGLSRVLMQFPKSVLDKKILPALLEEMKDRDLLSLILQNVFKIVKMLPSGRRAFTEKVIPKLREVFLSAAGTSNTKGAASERDTTKEAGLMVVLESMHVIVENCSGKDFKDEILPVILLAMESPTHPLVDASLRCLGTILPVVDYSTIRNEVFPVVASVFSKTSSLGIKIRGLEAFVILCGGKADEQAPSGDDSIEASGKSQTAQSKTTNAVLDKYSVQEKVVPLLKGIKTKEPAVMMAALGVFRQVGKIADSDFIAVDVLPALWSMCLGPLLNLEQFRSFMELIKALSDRVEHEQIRKLQELSSGAISERHHDHSDDFLSFGAINGTNGVGGATEGGEGDFERLVSGGSSGATGSNSTLDSGWDAASKGVSQEQSSGTAPVFQWSTPSPINQQTTTTTPPATSLSSSSSGAPSSRGLSSFAPLTPSSGSNAVQSFQTLQPQNRQTPSTQVPSPTPPTLDWSSPWNSTRTVSSPSVTTLNSLHLNQQQHTSTRPLNLSVPLPPLPPPPTTLQSSTSFHHHHQPTSLSNTFSPSSSFSIAPPPPSASNLGLPTTTNIPRSNGTNLPQKNGLDKYESLL